MKHAKDFVNHVERLIAAKVREMQDNELESAIEVMNVKQDFMKFLNKMYFKTREE